MIDLQTSKVSACLLKLLRTTLPILPQTIPVVEKATIPNINTSNKFQVTPRIMHYRHEIKRV